jgi:hypothetical protein
MRPDGATEPPAYTPPVDGTHHLVQASLTTLQAAVGGSVAAVAVPVDESFLILVHEDGLLLNMSSNSQASALTLRSIVGDAVLLARALFC